MGRKLDLTGQRFGRLVVVEEAGRTKHGFVLWKCRCDCGQEVVVSSQHLRSGNTTSCGCFNRERTSETHTKHGKTHHPLYSVWTAMLRRCGVYKGADDETRREYIDRGITVCEEWQNFETFYTWAIEHGYSKGLQIDRIDNDRGYGPDNCRWVTPKQNANNRRDTSKLVDGTPLAEFTSSLGIPTSRKNRPTVEYTRIRHEFSRHGSDEAILRAYGEAIAYRFGMKFVPFRKMFKA